MADRLAAAPLGRHGIAPFAAATDDFKREYLRHFPFPKGTDIDPSCFADGRLARLLDAVSMIDCMHNDNELDDEMREIVHAYRALNPREVADA